MNIRQMALVIATAAMCTWLSGQDAQWRGPDRDGKYPAGELLKEWPEGGPELLMKREDLGKGYSTPVLYKDRIFISGQREDRDVLTKLDMEGNILWETAYGLSWEKSFSETRCTPTILDDRVYIMGGMGTVACIDAATGEIIWEENTHEEFGGEFHRWGTVESLLVTGDAVISSPVGGRTAVVALDRGDGSLIWKSEPVGGARSYASPKLIEHNGKPLILAVSSEDLIAVEPSSGTVAWTYDLVEKHASRDDRINTVTPLYHNGEVFVTSGYDEESVMVRIDESGNAATLKWSSKALDNHHGGVVLVDGYIYGSNWINNGNGNWVCQDWETGEVMYEEEWNNKGSVIYADGLLYLLEEKQGHVGLVEPSPEGFRLISSFRLDGGSGPYWAHMSIYDNKLFIRHGEVLFVYDISAES